MHVGSAHPPYSPACLSPCLSTILPDFPFPYPPIRLPACPPVSPPFYPPVSWPARSSIFPPCPSEIPVSCSPVSPSACQPIRLLPLLSILLSACLLASTFLFNHPRVRLHIHSFVSSPERPANLLSASLKSARCLAHMSVCPPVLLFTRPLVCPPSRPPNIHSISPARDSIVYSRDLINIPAPMEQQEKNPARFNEFKLF